MTPDDFKQGYEHETITRLDKLKRALLEKWVNREPDGALKPHRFEGLQYVEWEPIMPPHEIPAPAGADIDLPLTVEDQRWLQALRIRP